MKRRDFLKISLAVGAASVWPNAGTLAQNGAQKPNILWLMMDDCRPDALGCYGTSWAKTPNFDHIAANGVTFESAITQCPICIPSRTSMKTSRYCHELGTMYMGDTPEVTPPYAATARSYPNLLNQWESAGYKPVNVGKVHALGGDWDHRGDTRFRESDRRHDEGETFDPVRLTTYGWQIGGTQDIHVDDTREGVLTERALDVLKELADAGTPFFLRVSYHPPHVPIQVPPPFMVDLDAIDLPFPTQEALDSKSQFEREQLRVYSGTLDLSEHDIRVARSTYYGMVNMVDYFVGKIMEQLRAEGLLENTIIAVNSDHGLAMGENGVHKKRSFYEEVVKSPLLFSWPGHIPSGRIVREPVEMIDLMPTLLDLSQMPIPEGHHGRSLVPLMHGDIQTKRNATFSEIDHSGSMYDPLRINSGRQVMVRTEDWKLIYFRDPRIDHKDGSLYNLKEDPWEFYNLYNDPQYSHVIVELESLADDWDQIE